MAQIALIDMYYYDLLCTALYLVLDGFGPRVLT